MGVTKRHIGWQKYEDIIEEQIRSPLTNMLINNIATQVSGSGEYEEYSYEDSFKDSGQEEMIHIPE